jgi:hypothetical protein
MATAPVPVCQLHLDDALNYPRYGRLVPGRIDFRYPTGSISAQDPCATIAADDTDLLRDISAERVALTRFTELGGVLYWDYDEPVTALPTKDLVSRIQHLLDDGFEVFAARDRLSAMTTPRLQVASRVDWFEIETVGTPGESKLTLPDLLHAVQTSSGYVRLGEHEVGLLDTIDLNTIIRLAEVGELDGDTIRFRKNQGFLLDALLQARTGESVRVDRQFAALRARCNKGITAAALPEPKPFGTTLRPHQREGLGWFKFLEQLGVGGCLADDMGLGKTVQVLALLERHRRRRPHPGPTLVVAPRSLLFHWECDATRFAPKLRTLAFVGPGALRHLRRRGRHRIRRPRSRTDHLRQPAQ